MLKRWSPSVCGRRLPLAAHNPRVRLDVMTDAARKLLEDALALPADERLKLASEIIASVDGPQDADWDAAWLAELDRRVAAAKQRGQSGSDWIEARARIMKRLGET